MSVNQFVERVRGTLVRSDGPKLRDLLRLNNAVALQAAFQGKQNPNWNPRHGCGNLPEPWDNIICCHLICLAAIQGGNHVEAYQQATSALTDFIRAFREDQTAWLVPVLTLLVSNLKALAENADEQLRRQGKPANKLEDLADKLRSCFAAAMAGSGDAVEKKLALLPIVNVNLKVLFRLNGLHLCKTLINSTKNRKFPDLEEFPASERVTFKYYYGRLHVFNEDYVQADAELQYAFDHCHKDAVKNKWRILVYLVPVKLLLGVLPTTALLDAYHLRQYDDVIESLRSGSVEQFEAAMEVNQYAYIQMGVYLLLEKLRNSVYRRLFKRVTLTWQRQLSPDPNKGHQVPLGLFHKALLWQGEDVDEDEVECIVANLIYRKYLKGYISHKNKIVVLSKADPFPSLSDVQFNED